MKKLLALILAMALVPSPALGAEGGAADAISGRAFSDVAADAWYAPYVAVCTEAGLMQGTAADLFSPEQYVTSLECVLFAVRLDAHFENAGPLPAAPELWGTVSVQDESGRVLFTHKEYGGYRSAGQEFTVFFPEAQVAPLVGASARLILNGETVFSGVFTAGENGAGLTFTGLTFEASTAITDAFATASTTEHIPDWAREGIYYAATHGLSLGALSADEYPASRSGFLGALEEVLYPMQFPALNTIEVLPDIPVDSYITSFAGGAEEYTTGNFAAFYRAGILSGVDEYGTFAGYLPLTRAECAAMLARILRPELRLVFTLTPYPWQTAYTLTPLGFSRDDWWNSSSVSWDFPDVTESPLEGQVLRVSHQEGSNVDYDQDGILSMDGTWLVGPGRYGEIGGFQMDGFAVVATTHYMGTAKYGAIDSTGLEILPPVYDGIGQVHDGLFVTESVGRYTVRDAQGLARGTLPASACAWAGIHEGMVLYQGDDGTWGYLDAKGAVAIPARFESAGLFYEGLAAVVQNGRAGFIDQTGATAVPFQLDPWSDGYYSSAYRFQGGVAIVAQDGKYFPIDPTGAQRSPHRYGWMEDRFSGGVAAYRYEGGIGYLTAEGAECPDPYTDCQIMAWCRPYYLACWSMGAYNYLGADGKPILPIWFSEASPLTPDGKAIVLREDGQYCRLELRMEAKPSDVSPVL